MDSSSESRTTGRARLERLVELAPWAAATLLVTLLGLTLAARFGHPFDLEWMEGGMLAHAWRIDRGLPVYPPPNPDFVPFVYPPGYAAVVALLGKLTGLSLPLGRAVSLVGLAGATSAAGWVVWRHTGRVAPAVFAAAVWLGAFPGSGAFYDLVRPDALAMGLTAWAIAVAVERWRGSEIAAGLLLASAFACKHNMAIFGLPLALVLLQRDGMARAARFAAASAVPALALTAWLQWVSDGNFLTYLVSVPSSHPMYLDRLAVMPRELGVALPISVAVVGLWCALRPAARVPEALASSVPVGAGILVATGLHLWGAGPQLSAVPAGLGAFGLGAAAAGVAIGGLDGAFRSWRWSAAVSIGATAVAVAALMRVHHGGYLNVYMPMHWAVACGFGLVLGQLDRTGWRTLAGGLATAELLFLAVSLDPGRYVPTAADLARGDRLVTALERAEGPVLSPMAAWLPVQAGHPPSLHMISVWDLVTEGGPLEEEVQVVQQAIDEQHYGTVVDGSVPFVFDVTDAYRVERAFPDDGGAMMPKSGFEVRPTRLRVPR